MNQIRFILFLLATTTICNGQAVHFNWAKQLGGTEFDEGRCIVVDASQNVYTAGVFDGTADFDPGPASYNMTGMGGDVFISKLDSTGKFIWAKQIEGPGYCNVFSIKLDQSGNMYLLGVLGGSNDLDPGPGTAMLSGGSMFLLKLDLSGNYIWVRQFGEGVGSSQGLDMAMDALGNFYITGVFAGNIDFDPGTGLFQLSTVSNSFQDMFVMKLNSSGDFVWAKQTKGFSSMSYGKSIALDANNNIYLTGSYSSMGGGYIDFDPGPEQLLITTLNVTAFILKLNNSGAFLMVKQLPSPNWSEGRAIRIDPAGNIITTGNYLNEVNLDLNSTGQYLYSAGGFDTYILKMTSTGQYIWGNSLGGTGNESMHGLFIDPTGNIYTTGQFKGSIDMDPGIPVYSFISNGENDIFIHKFTSSGDFVWAKQTGGNDVDVANMIFVSGLNVYSTGSFQNTTDMDPGAGVYNLNGFGNNDAFVQKLSPCGQSSLYVMDTTVCKNFSLNGQTYTSTGVYTQNLLNAKGCDSTISINLTINMLSSTEKITSCDSLSWHGKTYYASGNFNDTLSTANGCDSIVTLQLTITKKTVKTIDATICQGEVYMGYVKEGSYVDTFHLAAGCDSIRILNLKVRPFTNSVISKTICKGQSFFGYSASGIYYDTLVTATGCTVQKLDLIISNDCAGVYIPNAFSPDKDGLNDIFKPVIHGIVEEYYLRIYNRYGKVIFESRNHLSGWNGEMNGKPQSSGTYIYQLHLKTGGKKYEFKGTIVIIR